MPTARELLEQADALMRRNRKRGKGRLGVPTLTDALGVDHDASLAPTVILPDAPAVGVDPIALDARQEVDAMSSDPPMDADPISLDTLADVPVLTDAVVVWPPVTASLENAEAAGERIDAASDAEAVDADTGDAFPASAADAEAVAASAQPPAVLEQEPSEPPQEDAPAAPTAPRLDDDFILEIPPSQSDAPAVAADDSPIPPVAGPATLMPGSRDWDALAEEIRMQVLQRLDLFTDTGLREQLGARLSPIVERASAALVETINRELGELVRGYVAEAIEREIESWRNRGA
ncbi:MAG TPA: hypothetical protein VKU81_08870 [Casimicrobiaceae bacterium]|nr:hypothetical protein [Casimicrobiaceae bacterium]